jgi:replicative DNA helicase
VSAADLAEQATLGALMLLPEPGPGVWSWLRASDFAKPWHRDVYRVLRELHDAGGGTSVEDVAPALSERLGARRAGLPRLHDLVRVVPPDPDARSYALMVLDGGVRRELAQQAIVLRAGARAAAVQQLPQPMLAAIGSVTVVVEGVERRLLLAQNAPGPEGADVPGEGRALGVVEPLGADRFLSAYEAPSAAVVVEHERHLVGALIARPACIPDVAAVVDPSVFTSPMWADTYALTVDMHRRHRRLDVVTVAWESETTLKAGDPRPSPRELASAVEDGAYVDVTHTRHLVAAQRLVHLADAQAASLTAFLTSAGGDVLAVLETYRSALNTLERTSAALGRRTWCGQSSPGPALVPSASGDGLVQSLRGPAA